MKNKDLKRRIIEISYKKNLSHIGSCITAVDIIDEIYSIKKPDEKFVLSAGHSALALYCVLEKYLNSASCDFNAINQKLNAEQIFDHHGVHPDRCEECRIDCSSGSLGHGLGIAVGMAIADRSKNVYCLISDGECAEGSIYEALNVMFYQKITNLKVYLNRNGWAAYRKIESAGYSPWLYKGLSAVTFITDMNGWPDWLQGQNAHYQVMDEKMYQECLEVLK